MLRAERRHTTEEAYVAHERAADSKSELINGEIYAMSGAKPRHNVIALNTAAELQRQLRAAGSPCRVFNSDQRLRSETTGMNTYADAVVACGPTFHTLYGDALTNPKVIVEVLSTSTEDYDHGAKFAHYRTIESFVEYVLIAQRKRQVEHFRRLESGQWLLTVLEGDDAVLELPSIACSVPLRVLYADTDDVPGDDEHDRAKHT